jgi:hypothetical protein
VRKPQKREGGGFAFTTPLPGNLGEATEFDQPRLVGWSSSANDASRSLNSARNRSASLLCWKPTTRSGRQVFLATGKARLVDMGKTHAAVPNQQYPKAGRQAVGKYATANMEKIPWDKREVSLLHKAPHCVGFAIRSMR